MTQQRDDETIKRGRKRERLEHKRQEECPSYCSVYSDHWLIGNGTMIEMRDMRRHDHNK